MNRLKAPTSIVLYLGALFLSGGFEVANAAPQLNEFSRASARVDESLRGRFVRNDGQWDASIRFAARGSQCLIIAEAFALEVRSRGKDGGVDSVRFQLPDDQRNSNEPTVRGIDSDCSLHHFFLGDDPAKWRTRVPAFGRISLDDVVPGIDLIVHAPHGRSVFTYDVLCHEGGRLQDLVLRLDGVSDLGLAEDGSLVAKTAHGTLVQEPPRAFQLSPSGARTPVSSHFRIVDAHTFGFVACQEGSSEGLLIDPEVILSDVIGDGFHAFGVRAIAEDNAGNLVAAGVTDDAAFPVTPDAFDSTLNPVVPPTYPPDIFVAVYSPTENKLLYCTYLGGTQYEDVAGLHVNPMGAVIVSGITGSLNFPVTPGSFQTSSGGPSFDAYVCSLSSAGDALAFSTRLGGKSSEYVSGSALASNGDVIVLGQTLSNNFPTTPGCYSFAFAGYSDLFVTRLRADGSSLVYSTLVGGSDEEDGGEFVGDITISPTEEVYFVASSDSPDYPTTPGAFETTSPCLGIDCSNMVISHLSANGSKMLASTFLSTTNQVTSRGFGIAVDPTGHPIVVGHTNDDNYFVTPGAFTWKPEFVSAGFFITKLTPDLSALDYSIHLMHGDDRATDVAIDGLGCAIVTGWTQYAYLPTTQGCLDPFFNEGGFFQSDAFVMRVSPDGRDLWYSTHLGGWSGDAGECVALSRTGAVMVGGSGGGGKFPDTVEPKLPRLALPLGSTVTLLNLLPKGVDRYGAASAGSGGWPVIGVTGQPSVRRGEFGVTCYAAPKSSKGWLLVSAKQHLPALSTGGVGLLVDPSNVVLLPFTTSPTGSIIVKLDATRMRVGEKAYAQFVFEDLGTASGLCASNALEMIAQD